MATIQFVSTNNTHKADRMNKTTWSFTAGDTGVALNTAGLGDRSIQLSGVWNGATVVVEGSNDNVTWFTLNDPLSNALTFTADALKQISELTDYIRPRVSVGTVTSLAITLVHRRDGY